MYCTHIWYDYGNRKNGPPWNLKEWFLPVKKSFLEKLEDLHSNLIWSTLRIVKNYVSRCLGALPSHLSATELLTFPMAKREVLWTKERYETNARSLPGLSLQHWSFTETTACPFWFFGGSQCWILKVHFVGVTVMLALLALQRLINLMRFDCWGSEARHKIATNHRNAGWIALATSSLIKNVRTFKPQFTQFESNAASIQPPEKQNKSWRTALFFLQLTDCHSVEALAVAAGKPQKKLRGCDGLVHPIKP